MNLSMRLSPRSRLPEAYKILPHSLRSDLDQTARGEVPDQTAAIHAEMWNTLISARTASVTEIASQQHALSELVSLDQRRLTRILQSTKSLPTVLWCVLLTGGALTIMSACMFGAPNMKLQTFQVIGFSLLVSLSLVAIADIHRPFRGIIHVRNDAFRRSLQYMPPVELLTMTGVNSILWRAM